MAGIVYGDSEAQGLPPVNLPSFGDGARQPLQVLIQKSPQQHAATGGWGVYQADTQSPEGENKPDGGWSAYEPKQAQQTPEIGMGEAAMRGALHGATFGFYPAMAGAASGINAVLTGNGDFSTAYEKTRQAEEESQKAAEKQNPGTFIASDIAGNLPSLFIPGVGLGKASMAAAEALPRIGQAVKSGAVAGGLFGAGEQTSQGGSVLDVAKGAGGGAAAGAALGGVLGSGVEGASKVGQTVGRIARGKKDADLEAQRMVIDALKQDQRQVEKVAKDRQGLFEAKSAGTDVRLADLGGDTTKRLMRAATNMAPEAGNIVRDAVEPRFAQQGGRIARFIRSNFGGVESDIAQDAIKAEARRQNGPLYKLAYRAGEGGMWSPELERLSSSPALQQAAKNAAERGGNRSVAEGMGSFNPGITFQNGILKISKKGGPPSYPDMQFWDYVQRELRDLSEVAKRAGRNEEADAIGSLHRQLLGELDKINPSFARARGTAASFFKADNAVQAGANFVMDTSISVAKASQVVAKMSAPERELFKRGFAGELSRLIERTGYNRDVLNSIFLNNEDAKRRLLIALGQQDAARLESLLRVESIVDRTRKALGNSTTTQQISDAGKFAGTLATIEGLKGALNPAYLVAIPMIWAGRQTAKQVDERVFTKVAELLMSEDPRVLARGLDIAAKNNTVRTALRYASDLSSRQLVNLLGPSGVAAGALTGANYMRGSLKEPEKSGNQDYPYEGQQHAPP